MLLLSLRTMFLLHLSVAVTVEGGNQIRARKHYFVVLTDTPYIPDEAHLNISV